MAEIKAKRSCQGKGQAGGRAQLGAQKTRVPCEHLEFYPRPLADNEPSDAESQASQQSSQSQPQRAVEPKQKRKPGPKPKQELVKKGAKSLLQMLMRPSQPPNPDADE
mmetsp:Transcript_89035/g.154414  ORF Transcript_89035/g.154414 Transcript_89035/m.154414 type:complete len:108 (-) Transcript_89035:1083-1406(-)